MSEDQNVEETAAAEDAQAAVSNPAAKYGPDRTNEGNVELNTTEVGPAPNDPPSEGDPFKRYEKEVEQDAEKAKDEAEHAFDYLSKEAEEVEGLFTGPDEDAK